MKRIILSAIFIMAIVVSANAQDYKWFIGGQAGYVTGKSGNTRTTAITVAPEVGFRFSKDFAFASSFGYTHLTTKVGNNKAKSNGFIIGPYLRYTFLKKGIVGAFVDGGAKFGLSDVKGFEAGLRPGISIDLTNRLSVVASLGFVGYNDGKNIGRNKYGKGFEVDFSGNQSSFGFYFSI
ncbi:MAG: hypothetical protein LBQ28_07785 [Prevotellaceae bacterium]|jgi:hypothetical protein|nr:hypothetical protein [Prevotellaceae bacterium]